MTRIQSSLAIGACSMLLVLAAAPALAADAASQPTAKAEPLAALCDDCALVRQISSETRKGKGGALGVVGGAVLGGVLGHQVGGGTGKTLATVAGAAAGGYAGNEVQKSADKSTVWSTRVTLKDGSERSFETDANPGFKVGEVVRIEGAQLKKR